MTQFRNPSMTSFVKSAGKRKMSFFGGSNPFATKVGQLIEQATDGSLASENWGMYMEICDTVNETEEGPKDAIKAIKKRLTTNTGKNFTVIMYTLTVLETCVKNCGKRFHVYVANKDFLQELIKIIGPKNDPPQVVQEKVLSLIQTWADAFQGIPELKEVGKVYQDLKNKGIEFPMTDLDHMAPIHTPARSTPQRAPSSRAPQQTGYPPAQSPFTPPPAQPQSYPPQAYPPGGGPPPQQQQQPAAVPASGGPVFLSPEQLAKLRSELDTVQQNCKVFSEMLTEMNTTNEDPSDVDLLHELNSTCRQMQKRLVGLVEQVQNEQVTEELLHINDELNNVFLRYDRYERLCAGARTQGAPATVSQPQAQPPPSFAAATAAVPAPLPPPASHPRVAAPAPTQPEPQPATANLINFDDPTPPAYPPEAAPAFPPPAGADLSQQLAGLDVGGGSISSTLGQLNTTPATNANVASPGAEEDFDMFAQSRQAFDQNKQNLSGTVYTQQTDDFSGGLSGAISAKTNDTPQEQSTRKMGEMDEMEKWLQENTGATGKQESATSSEFDQFLAERAREIDQLPDRSQQNRGGRQMQKEDQENALFSL